MLLANITVKPRDFCSMKNDMELDSEDGEQTKCLVGVSRRCRKWS